MSKPTSSTLINYFVRAIEQSILDEQIFGSNSIVRHGNRDITVNFQTRDGKLFAHLSRGEKSWKGREIVFVNDVFSLLSRLDKGRLNISNLAEVKVS